MALYFGTDKIQKVAVKFEGLSGTDTSDATLTSGEQMLEGVSAYSKGKKYSGTIPTKDVSTPSISISSDGLITAQNTQPAGYTSGATKTATKQLTIQAAKTVTPTTAEQTAVDSGVYTTGSVKVGAIQTETKEITSNGEHTPTSGKYFSAVTVNVQPNLQTKTVTPSESEQTVSADSSYQGLSSVTVNAISNQYIGSGITQKTEATIMPGTTDQTLNAGQYLSGTQTIKGDANLVAGNIADGVSIFGVAGTHLSGIDTSDATAVASDLVYNKTAYVNGEKVTGSRRKFSEEPGTGNIYTSKFFTGKNLSVSGNGRNAEYGGAVLKAKAEQDFYMNAEDTIIISFQAGTATAADVLTGKTFTSVPGNNLTGTMPSKDAEIYIPTTADQTISASQYLAGDQTIKGDANLIAENIRSGVTIFGVEGTHSGSGGVDTSDATATSSDILSGKTAYVNGQKITGGYGIATATANFSSTTDTASITYTVKGEPIAWSVIQITNGRDWDSSRFIIACNSQGNTISVTTESSYGRRYAYSKYATAEYSDGTLTISTSSVTNTGNFRGGQTYQLLYVYENIVEVEPEPELPEGYVGSISSENVISLADSKLSAGTYTIYYEDENNNKLDGWGSIGTIKKGGSM